MQFILVDLATLQLLYLTYVSSQFILVDVCLLKTKAKLARKQAAFVSTLNQLHPGEVQVGIWRQYGRGPLAALKMQNELDPNTDISRNDSAARALQLICGTSNCSFSLLALYDRLFFFFANKLQRTS